MYILSTYLRKSTSFVPAGTDLVVKLLKLVLPASLNKLVVLRAFKGYYNSELTHSRMESVHEGRRF
jgi:hypothetical protein